MPSSASPPPVSSRAVRHAPVLADMRIALRSEYGARCIYPLLVRRSRDEELTGVLNTLAAEEREQVERLRALMKGLGAEPARRSVRRTVMAHMLYAASPLVGLRFALRLCYEAESRVARWYHGYGAWFAEHDERELALTCHEMSVLKRTHAQVLQAFIDHAPGRWRS